MKRWKLGWITLLGGLLVPFACLAMTVDPKDLVEVNAQNKPRCVEYSIVGEKQYCSVKALHHAETHSALYDFDRLKVKFDNRSWIAGWGQNTPEVVTVEYIVTGDDIHHWRELVTSQMMPGLQGRPTPPQFVEKFAAHLKKQVPSAEVQVLSSRPEEVIFEFKVAQPVEMAQHELQRVFTTSKGLYVVHYVIKQPDMGAKKRSQWLTLLKQATPKP